MTKKIKSTSLLPSTPREHIRQLIEWISQGVYEKEQIIAVALLCAVAGENMFLLGPPGLTTGYLPDADVVFLDEIWKAGPSIQNTLLTVINEHIFHNGGQIMHTPMKVLIAASNELPAKDEGLEALWDRFLVRMVSNCIESDASFFKMIKSSGTALNELPDSLFITDELYAS